jgi:hypothetical protein
MEFRGQELNSANNLVVLTLQSLTEAETVRAGLACHKWAG